MSLSASADWSRKQLAPPSGETHLTRKKATIALTPHKSVSAPPVEATVAAPEQELLERCLTGDVEAFDSLMALHEDRVYRVALRISGNPDEAADLTQECFLRVFTALPGFRREAAFSTWLYRIVTNVCLDQLKRRARRREVQPSPAQGEEQTELWERLPADGERPDEGLIRQQRQQAVQQAIATLPEHQRAVLVLYDLEGFSYEEIAEMVDTSLGTVKSRLNRARLALRNRLEPHMELFPEVSSQTDQ